MSPIATSTLPRTAARSQQLVAASEKTSLDPFRDVDWSIPVDDRAFHVPPELLPLYGTLAWDAMTEPERIAYSRHEAVALLGAGISFENALGTCGRRSVTRIVEPWSIRLRPSSPAMPS